MCDCDVSVYPEFYVPTRWVQAHRAHRCDECGASIELRELHKYGAGKLEGEFYEWRMCAKCDALHRAHTAAMAAFGDPHCNAAIGELKASIGECRLEHEGYSAAFRDALVKLGGPAEAATNA